MDRHRDLTIFWPSTSKIAKVADTKHWEALTVRSRHGEGFKPQNLPAYYTT